MKTVVQFYWNKANTGKDRNRLYTRTLRRIGFIDVRTPPELTPKNGQFWLVDIIRENLSARRDGGCFILKPIQQVEPEPLIHGMYTMAVDNNSVILTPGDMTKFWVMSHKGKASFLETIPEAQSVVISHGGPLWPRRKPPSDVMDKEIKSLDQE